MLLALTLIATLFAAPLSCKQVARFDKSANPRHEALTWIPDQGVRAADLDCIAALDIDPFIIDVALTNLEGEVPADREDVLHRQTAPILAATTITWIGIDYTHALFVDSREFDHPSEIFPEKPFWWNLEFSEEMLPGLELVMQRALRLDFVIFSHLNDAASPDQIAFAGFADSHPSMPFLALPDLRRIVREYPFTGREGVGYVWIVERLSKDGEVVDLHQVFFDLATREIYWTRRARQEATGTVFVLHWYRPLKAALDDAKRAWKKIEKEGRLE